MNFKIINSKLLTFFFLSILLLTFACNSPNSSSIEESSEQVPPQTVMEENTVQGYDSVLAKRLGADAYGMKKYVLALLKAGPNRTEDKEEAAKLQMAHMQNIQRLAEEGKLVVAGPFWGEEGSDLKGLYIFNVESIEEAEALTNTDPAIQSGSLIMELHPWYGSAALVDVNNIHNKITKQNITD